MLADGEVLVETRYYGTLVADLPPETREYTMRVNVDRSEYARLSTSVTAEWTFRSGHAENTAALPLPTVRFAPKLDDHNSAPAGESCPCGRRSTTRPGTPPNTPSSAPTR